MNLLERKTETITLTDRSDWVKMVQFINRNQGKGISLFSKFWDEMKSVVTVKNVAMAMQSMNVPIHWRKTWDGIIKDFVEIDIHDDIWMKAIQSASEKIDERIKKRVEKQTTNQYVKEWMDIHGAELIVELTTNQYKTIHALLHDQVTKGITSPYTLSKFIKSFVGLTSREALAVARHQLALMAEGMSVPEVLASTKKYADFLHGVRARRIARTELSFGYGHGQLGAALDAEKKGYFPGELWKEWIAGGPNPCERCEGMDGEKVKANEPFSEGVDTHPLHPNCECSVGYFIYRY